MSTDLTKMVEEARSKHRYNEKPPVSGLTLLRILTVVAAEIETNREEIEGLKERLLEPTFTIQHIDGAVKAASKIADQVFEWDKLALCGTPLPPQKERENVFATIIDQETAAERDGLKKKNEELKELLRLSVPYITSVGSYWSIEFSAPRRLYKKIDTALAKEPESEAG